MARTLRPIKLKTERKKRDMSRAELSRLSGVNYYTLGLVESGRLFPYNGHVERIAEALAISVKRAWQMMELEDER